MFILTVTITVQYVWMREKMLKVQVRLEKNKPKFPHPAALAHQKLIIQIISKDIQGGGVPSYI